jgi:hypothetical protein
MRISVCIWFKSSAFSSDCYYDVGIPSSPPHHPPTAQNLIAYKRKKLRPGGIKHRPGIEPVSAKRIRAHTGYKLAVRARHHRCVFIFLSLLQLNCVDLTFEGNASLYLVHIACIQGCMNCHYDVEFPSQNPTTRQWALIDEV